MRNQSIVYIVGVTAGLLFFLHALIPFSHAWPLIWPAIAGISLMIFLKKSGSLKDFFHVLKTLFKTSLLTAGVFFVFTLVVLYLLGIPAMEDISHTLGANGPVIINSALIFSLLLASGIGIFILMLSGSVFYPFLKKE